MGRKNFEFYPAWEDASSAVQQLGITNRKIYNARYKEDPRLPADPQIIYANNWKPNGGLKGFLGTNNLPSKFYLTWQEASIAAITLGISTGVEYAKRYREDSRLPANPRQKYAKIWNENSGWYGFLGKKYPSDPYLTWREASAAAQALNITSSTAYQKHYRVDPRLPSLPNKVYASVWVKNDRWYGFLNKSRKLSNFYSSWEEASAATQSLGISGKEDYAKRYKEDPLLPAVPEKVYAKAWYVNGRWYGFVGKAKPLHCYSKWEEASAAARKLGIVNQQTYKDLHKNDPRLPSNPSTAYADVWLKNEGLNGFLGTSKRSLQFYPTWEEAAAAVRSLGITTFKEYRTRYKEDPRLPVGLRTTYSEQWIINGGFRGFLLPSKIDSLVQLKDAVRILRITNSKQYRAQYKQYQLPVNPERTFKEDWVDWYHLCGIQRPYTYQESCVLVRSKRISNQSEYRSYRANANDPRLPGSPAELYKDEWVNWYVFLDKEEPFRVRYILDPYTPWAEEIKEYMKTALGGDSKESNLCRFVRNYIQKHRLGKSPSEFLMNTFIKIESFREFLNGHNETLRRPIALAVDGFLDHILRTQLTEEDDETGEITSVADAKNRLKEVIFDTSATTWTPDESVKPALAYQYVDAMKQWIIPPKAKTFKDLAHLQIFDADWHELSDKNIDRNDPDCILKTENNKLKIWFPGNWILAYALASVPARGRQLAYNDSGEADEQISKFEAGKISWVKNISALAGMTKRQGFIKQYPDEQFGMHFTTNKTSKSRRGYNVPWMPDNLAYWVIRLRSWQTKYNPITAPTPWLSCERTNMNESQRRAKGSNCFLFRDFGREEPPYFNGRLTNRIAAALYHSQPKDLIFATLRGCLNNISGYKSLYTPHSMRVSLITAYVMEFGLPIEIIMKVVGHSTIVMSIYYLKVGSEGLRQRFSEGEKIALRNKVYAAQRMIEQNRIESIKHELVSNSEEALRSINNTIPSGNFLIRDYGICPYAGTRCYDGGEIIASSCVRAPVRAGYLGIQNCLQCRHFLSGPAFLGGLLSLANEISLQANSQSFQYGELSDQAEIIKQQIECEDDSEYDAEKRKLLFDESNRISLQIQLRKKQSEIESAAKKLDMFICDIQAANRLLKQCIALVNQSISQQGDGENTLQLIAKDQHDLQLLPEETSYFRQLCEVCENAEIYESASADIAIPQRTQLIDRMSEKNNIQPKLFMLSQKQQLVVGNQLTKLLITRLKSWERVDQLIDGQFMLIDLPEEERVTSTELNNLFKLRLPHSNGGLI